MCCQVPGPDGRKFTIYELLLIYCELFGMWKMSLLGDAIFTSTQKKVLSLLYGQPEKSFYTKEIIRLAGMGVATIKRELDRMLASGILSLTIIGNQYHYQANADCPVYFELLVV